MSELYDSRKEIERLYETQRACIDRLPLIDELKARIAFLEAANQILASERDTYKRLLGEEIEIAVERA